MACLLRLAKRGGRFGDRPSIPRGACRRAISGGPDGVLRLWNLETFALVREFEPARDSIRCAAFTPDGKHVAAGEDSGVIHFWEAKSGKLVRQFKGHAEGVPQITFSSDGKWLLSAGHDKTVRLWRDDGAVLGILTGHANQVSSVAISPNGRTLATSQRQVKLWDLETGRLVRGLEPEGEYVQGVSFSPDGSRVAFARSLAGRWESMVANPNGGSLQRLTHAASIDTDPAWSPTGREIAFTSNRAGSPPIYVMDAQGTNVRRISGSGGNCRLCALERCDRA